MLGAEVGNVADAVIGGVVASHAREHGPLCPMRVCMCVCAHEQWSVYVLSV